MVEQLFIQKPNIYPFSLIFSLSLPRVLLSLSTLRATNGEANHRADLEIWSKLA
jgi:hypothetical protein